MKNEESQTGKRPNKEITEQVALQRLMALCARGEHSSGDMLAKLRLWHLPEDAQARIMARLTKERFVDDARFARAFVSDKVKYNQWGPRKIAQALAQKGVDRETAAVALDEIDDEEYLHVLRPLLQSKRRSISGRTEYERQMKLMRFALGRGFTMEQVQRAIDN